MHYGSLQLLLDLFKLVAVFSRGSPKNAMSTQERKYSDYYKQLEAKAKERYDEKLLIIETDDPYTFAPSPVTSTAAVPNIEYPDIYNYLINTPSPYTKEELKAYKSLEGYKYLLAGWVGDVSAYTFEEKVVMTAKVRHSQSVAKTALCPWIAAKKEGTVLCSHCTCMAGLGEACSHIAALLFTVETHNRLYSDTACTSQLCAWLPPSLQSVNFAPISDINFTTPATKRKKAATHTPQKDCSEPSPRKKKFVVPSPSEEEMKTFFKELSKTGKPALLSIIQEHCDDYVQDYSTLSTPLSALFEESCMSLPYSDLLKKCELVFNNLTITEDQAKNIECTTREQARSKLWFKYRAGRVTASKFKSAACTDVSQPSKSLIKTICYPESYVFTSAATRWGCEHEKTAREEYVTKVRSNHINFAIRDKGLVIHPQFPHFGASPDGFVKCSCCGWGVVEIKCPFSCRNLSFRKASEESTFCLEILEDGSFTLKKNHAYFYQIQLQMKLCEVMYCDFVVWRVDELVNLRVSRDDEFLKEAMDRATTFFKYGVLPELVGKWYTHPCSETSAVPTQDLEQPSSSSATTSNELSPTEKKWCYCRGEDSGEMIGCENDNCPILWFHTKCLKIKCIPKKAWYCPECRKKN